MRKILVIIFLLISTNLFSAESPRLNFTIETFEQAKKNGETVVVTAWNKYCGICKKQKVVLDEAEKNFKALVIGNEAPAFSAGANLLLVLLNLKKHLMNGFN